jgi:hypothetical protein
MNLANAAILNRENLLRGKIGPGQASLEHIHRAGGSVILPRCRCDRRRCRLHCSRDVQLADDLAKIPTSALPKCTLVGRRF